MKITNRTKWRTEDLRAIARGVLERECTPKERKKIHLTFVEATRGVSSRGALGRCYLNSWHPTIVMPKTTSRVVRGTGNWKRGNHDPVVLAFVIGHELAHARGKRHDQMRGSRHDWYGSWSDHYSWAESLPLRPAEPKARPRKGDEEKLVHAAKMLSKAVTRVKRARTIEKKWQTKVRYYEKKMAAAGPKKGD